MWPLQKRAGRQGNRNGRRRRPGKRLAIETLDRTILPSMVSWSNHQAATGIRPATGRETPRLGPAMMSSSTLR
jgi:hypothetical protein